MEDSYAFPRGKESGGCTYAEPSTTGIIVSLPSPVTDLVHQAIIDILKLGNASLKLGGDGEDWIKIIQELEEVRMDFSQCLERKELIQRIFQHLHQ